jgi:hypothetical protein
LGVDLGDGFLRDGGLVAVGFHGWVPFVWERFCGLL